MTKFTGKAKKTEQQAEQRHNLLVSIRVTRAIRQNLQNKQKHTEPSSKYFNVSTRFIPILGFVYVSMYIELWKVEINNNIIRVVKYENMISTLQPLNMSREGSMKLN